MKIAIISIGNELLKGTIQNSNLATIGRELMKSGVAPFTQITINDTDSDIKDVLDYLYPKADVIICTGGLGPTTDDITVTSFSEFLGLKLYLHTGFLEKMEEYLNYKQPLSVYNKKQAYVPEGCKIIPNNNGTAPGVYIERENKHIFLLPGPPAEMTPMLLNSIIPEIKKHLTQKLCFETLYTTDIAESELQRLVDVTIGQPENIDIAYRAVSGVCELTFSGIDKKSLQKCSSIMSDKLGNSILKNNYQNACEELLYLLEKYNLTFATAESCTGGMIASKMTGIAGASKIFKGSVVVYSNELKERLLGVNKNTLDTYGAVSKQCVTEMIYGCCKNLNVDSAIAITGIAGPDGGTREKPVGTVYIATKIKDSAEVKKYSFKGDRDKIRLRSTIYAMTQFRKQLLKFCDETSIN